MQMTFIQSNGWTEIYLILREKGRDLTQSYDKRPYTHRKNKYGGGLSENRLALSVKVWFLSANSNASLSIYAFWNMSA